MDGLWVLADELERFRYEAMLQGNVGRLAVILSESLIYRHTTGRSVGKEGLLSEFSDGGLQYLNAEHEIVGVMGTRDFLLVDGRLRAQAQRAGAGISGIECMYFAIWLKESVDWRLAAYGPTVPKRK